MSGGIAQYDLVSAGALDLFAVLMPVSERLEPLDRRQLEVGLGSAMRHSVAEPGSSLSV